ncbi:MAG: glycosyl hydrolase-related protein [Limisphaerales bacterium]
MKTLALALILATGPVSARQVLAAAASPWRILIANDTCPDVTWGFTQAQTRQAFVDLIAAHLDEMTRTDALPLEDRDHYNATAFIEVEAFLEKCPQRRDELFRRIRQGRLCVSPFLCNSLWGFQSVEGALRVFYPARRMERGHGMPIDVAEHIELPSLPWGMATLAAGCGIRWLSVPFLDYDSTFKGLKNPPLFRLEGPDGSEVRVVMDPWASLKASYSQGGYLLKEPKRVASEWVPHYEGLGAAYPLRTIFASGTHSDINPDSYKQARGFADGILGYNGAGTNAAKLVNGTLAQFCAEVDAVEAASPFLSKLRGCFGQSWQAWPVSLARTAAALRENERAYMVAESLVALAGQAEPNIVAETRGDREKAEWNWAMLSDHAWNGANPKNRSHNAQLRREWAEALGGISRRLTSQAWDELGLKADSGCVTVFNPLSFTRDILVECAVPADVTGMKGTPSQVQSEGAQRRMVFVAMKVPSFGFREYSFDTNTPPSRPAPPFSGTATTLEGPFYRLRVDTANGGLASLVHKASGRELRDASSGRALCQTVFDDGQERLLSDVECQTDLGAVRAQMRVIGHIGDIRLTNVITLYAALDRVDFDVLLEKPATTNEQRLLTFFPVGEGASDLRIETTGAVLRPQMEPEGDLLPGADSRRFGVQGFVDYSPPGRIGVSVAPVDAYLLRLDQGSLAFEPLGNDQNWKEVTQDQDGESHFRFRYSLRAHAPGYDNAATLAWSRDASAPLTLVSGRLPKKWLDHPYLEVDPTCALVTCMKPADDAASDQTVVRLWETAGRTGSVVVTAPGYRAARETDLLEREREALAVEQGKVSLNARGYGFAAVKLIR